MPKTYDKRADLAAAIPLEPAPGVSLRADEPFRGSILPPEVFCCKCGRGLPTVEGMLAGVVKVVCRVCSPVGAPCGFSSRLARYEGGEGEDETAGGNPLRVR